MAKYMKVVLGIVAAALFTTQAHAATIWQPTDNNVNIIQIPFTLSLRGGTLALFEDTDVAFSAPLVLGSDGGVFAFSDNMDGTFDVTALTGGIPTGPALVMDGDEFLLAVSWGAGYFGDSVREVNAGDPTTYRLTFTDGVKEGRTLAVDVAAVPLPAAAWLFGSALLGLVAVKRKKA